MSLCPELVLNCMQSVLCPRQIWSVFLGLSRSCHHLAVQSPKLIGEVSAYCSEKFVESLGRPKPRICIQVQGLLRFALHHIF